MQIRLALDSAVASLGFGLLAAPASAQCLEWTGPFQSPGLTNSIDDALVFDDGSGPELWLVGRFPTAGDVFARHVVRYDGAQWIPAAQGFENRASALGIHDDGTGPAVYAAGSFPGAVGVPGTDLVARWDGSVWNPVGGSVISGAPSALASFDDGSGAVLYMAGDLIVQGAQVRLARWDGATWWGVGQPTTGSISTLRVFDDGSGPALYAAGSMYQAGGLLVNGIARWDGTSWSDVGGGMTGLGGGFVWISALAAFDDGTGPGLYAAGQFTAAGGNPALNIARWDGTSWSALGSGLPDTVWSLAVHDDGGGARLHAGGKFEHAGGLPASKVAAWDGATWSALGGFIDEPVTELVSFDDGSGAELVLGGELEVAGGVGVHRVASWDGSAYAALSAGGAPSTPVFTQCVVDLGAGPELFVGGRFRAIGTLPATGLASWDSNAWTAVGDFATGGAQQPPDRIVRVLATWDDGTGLGVYAGGDFDSVDAVPRTTNIARWNGATWSSLVTGTNGDVDALAVHDDGGGDALYVGGSFTEAGGVAVGKVARWDGTGWAALGSGLPVGTTYVHALAGFDDGSGADLYAGGQFTQISGVPANNIARWDGTAWAQLGAGLNNKVEALYVFDDGTGAALYAGGQFDDAGGVFTNRIARWDGASWSALGQGVDGRIKTIVAFDGGHPSGPELYVGGDIALDADSGVVGIARWNGSEWCGLQGGIVEDDNSLGFREAQSLVVWDDGSGPALSVGGDLTVVGEGVVASFLAHWRDTCPSEAGVPYCFGTAATCPCGNAGFADRGCDNPAGTGGAKLTVSDYAPDGQGGGTATIHGAGFPGGVHPAVIVMRSRAGEVPPVAFGDGLRCVRSQGLVRFGARLAVDCASTHAVNHGAGPGTFYYQLWYRSNPGTFCTPAAFNLSNGYSLIW